MASFATLPPTARSKPEPFKAAVPQEQLDELHQLVRLSKIGPKTFENEQTDRKSGVSRDWLINAKAAWEKFDWRQVENRINSLPNFTLPIKHGKDTLNIHFAALFSQKKDATPLILLHGWPGSFLEFIPILEILSKKYTPETLPYHVIVPSLPGYAYSSGPPLDKDFRVQDIAAVSNSLMVELGLGEGYVAQGGDIGCFIARILTAAYDNVKAAHINMCFMPAPENVAELEINEKEQKGLARAKDFMDLGSSYAMQHASKPSTIGLVLAANPVSLLAWISEKFLAWTDEDPSIDDILASVSLYWFTESFPRAIYPYRQLFLVDLPGAWNMAEYYVKKPLGYSWFPEELAPIPRSWAATTGNLVFYREHDSGGHFAAMEKPEVLLKDIEDFVAQISK